MTAADTVGSVPARPSGGDVELDLPAGTPAGPVAIRFDRAR